MRFPIASILMIFFGGIFFFLYTIFNYAFHSASGLKPILWNSANETMGVEQLSSWNDLMVQLPQGFGLACVMCFGLAIVIFLVDIFSHPQQEM